MDLYIMYGKKTPDMSNCYRAADHTWHRWRESMIPQSNRREVEGKSSPKTVERLRSEEHRKAIGATTADSD